MELNAVSSENQFQEIVLISSVYNVQFVLSFHSLSLSLCTVV